MPLPLTGAFISGPFHVGRAQLHGPDDVVVAGAAAQVAFKLLANLRFAGTGVAPDQVDRADHHPRCAESALQTMALLECRLHRAHVAVRRSDALDSGYLCALELA